MNKVLLLAATMLVALLGLSGSAFAATGLERVGAFAETYPDGQPAHQKRIAVNHASGDVYVTDQVNDQIVVYRPNGTSADQLTTFGSGDLSDPFGIAIDQSTGDVYVSDANGIAKYDSDGAATPTLTKDGAFSVTGVSGALAFDAASGSLLIADTVTNTVRRYSTAATAGATFDGSAGAGSPGAFAGLQDLAVDSTGDVIVVDASSDPAIGNDPGSSRVLRYAAGGGFQAAIGSVTRAATVAVRPSSDEVIVSGEQNTVFSGGVPKLHLFAPDGTPGYVAPIDDGGNTQYATVSGVASATGADGQLFVATDNANDPSYGYISVQVFDGFVLTAPGVSDVTAVPSEVGAKLNAKVNPNHLSTTWTFEYGTTTDYGKQFPATPASIAAGTNPVAITRTIGGLQPGTTYHYRMVATNEAGTTNGEDHTFTTKTPMAPGGGGGAEGRAYEQVSPINKGGSPVDVNGTAQAEPSGNALAFNATSGFPGSPTNVASAAYLSRRTSAGWSTEALDGPQRHWFETSLVGPTLFLSDDLSSTFQIGAAIPASAGQPGQSGLYLRDNRDGSRRLIAAGANVTNDFARPNGAALIGATPDFSHIAFTSLDELVPGVPPANHVYEYFDGRLRIVDRLPDGSISDGAELGILHELGHTQNTRTMSADGRRIIFADQQAGALYQRVDGTSTIALSVSQRAGASSTPVAARLAGASTDGQIVYFTAVSGLTNAGRVVAGDGSVAESVYRFATDTGILTDLMPSGPYDIYPYSSVTVSADGRTVMFFGDITGALYVARDNIVTKVADGVAEVNLGSRAMSPNGRYVAFGSDASLTGSDNTDPGCKHESNNSGTPDGICEDVFRYDTVAGALDCVSCSDLGVNRNSALHAESGRFSDYRSREILDDGTLFFNSEEQLAPQDRNGRQDVYEWSKGTTTIISDPRQAADSGFAEASPDGRDVFFYTDARLVAQDRDGVVDLYDARRGGGIAAQNQPAPAPVPCDGEACQGPSAAMAPPPTAASIAFAGAGDLTLRRAAALTARPKISVARKAVSGNSFIIEVKAPGKGKITASGNALQTAKRTVTSAATYRLRLSLTSKARTALKRDHRLRLAVRVAYRSVEGVTSSASLTVTVMRPKAKQSARGPSRRATALSSTIAKGR